MAYNKNAFIKLFQESVSEYGEKTALIDPAQGRSLSYKELEEYSGRIASKLKNMGAEHGCRIAIVLPNSIEAVSAMLAAMKLGAAFTVLNPDYPPERLDYIYRDCNACITLKEDFFEDADSYACLEDGTDILPDDLAMLVYTSGSTGNPKGVMINNRALYEAVDPLFEPEDNVGLGAPFFFIAGTRILFNGFFRGSTMTIINADAMRDPVLLADVIETGGITATFISPKVLRFFTPRSDTLRLVITGSERLSGIYPGSYRLVNRYALSESVGSGLQFEVDRPYDNTPIGEPTGKARVYLLDEDGNETDEGEICLSGHLSTGYLNLPEETDRVFASNPFKERDGFEVMIHTGDIGKRLADGNIVYLNRRDWMVKINGQRVEPGEIETVLRSVNGIEDAVVRDFTGSSGQTYLCGFYVSKNEISEDIIIKSLKEKLPDYMIPAAFVCLPALPVNANGKLDRSALKEPLLGAKREGYATAENEVQAAVADAFEQVLGIEEIGIDDDFYALGGDSIKAMMLQSVLGTANMSITASDIYEAKTPRALAERIENIKNDHSGDTDSIQKTGKRPDIYPLSVYERGMYIEQKLSPDSTEYNLNIALIINGASSGQIRDALNRIFAAHEAFHSYYGSRDGIPVRILADHLPTITEKTAKDRDEVISIIGVEDAPFNLEEDIPLRPVLYAVRDGSFILHLSIHHIAFDGGSAGIFCREVCDLLSGRAAAFSEKDLSDIPDLYGFQNDKGGMDYYREMFADGLPENEMPIRGARPAQQPLGDKIESARFDTALLHQMDDTCKRLGVTEFELIFAAISMALGRYTASDDVVLGIPANMRPAGAGDVIGMFVNMAPVRVRPVRDKSLREYISEVSSQVRSATYGAATPFEDIVKEFGGKRQEGRSPIFDVSVNYLINQPVYDKDGLYMEFYAPLQHMTRDFDMNLRKDSGEDGGLELLLSYSSELFESEVVRGFTQLIMSALQAICEDSYQSIRNALSLPAGQMEKLESFSTSASGEPDEKLLHRLFERRVRENPENTALVATDRIMTYRMLDESANRVANFLIERGVHVGDRVAILLPRTSRFFSAMFGILKSGAAFIPCDPNYPPERIANILKDSSAVVLLTTGDRLSDFSSDDITAVDIEEAIKDNNTNSPDVEMSPDDLAYMIYTSGSTGKPKGVMLTHLGITNYLTPHEANLHMKYIHDHITSYLSVTTVSFDMSFKEHAATLCNGKKLVFASDDEANDPQALSALMDQNEVDCINATPSRLQQYLYSDEFCRALSRCRLIMSGGEAYPLALRDEIRRIAPKARIINTYGPTEITVSCNGADLTDADHVSVGRPLYNYKEYIVDRFGDIAPYGVAGQLYVGGVGVARGYCNLPDKTAEVFVEYEGLRMYKTGDKAKWDRIGNVLILGRLDDQVKLRGLRIELSEIENAMDTWQTITKSVAALVQPEKGEDFICGYFVADEAVDTDELRAHLKKSLASYMVPTEFVQLDEIPVTSNGKVDKKALPMPERRKAETVPPQNEQQQRIYYCIEKTLGHSDFGINTDIFDAGLSSLGVIQLAALLSKEFDTHIAIRVFKDNPTVEMLEKYLLAQADDVEYELQEDYPLTQTQMGILVESLSHRDTTIYNIPHLFRLSDNLDILRLSKAVEAAIMAHPYLSARIFTDENGSFRVRRDDSALPVVEILKQDNLPEQLPEPFDLLQDRLYRARIYDTSDGRFLFLEIHHICCDGSSMSILISDINAAYEGKELQPESYTGFEVALDEQKLRSTTQLDRAKEYYDKLLAEAEPEMLPDGDVFGATESSDTLFAESRLDLGDIEDFIGKNSLSKNAFYNAAFAYVLSRFTGRSDALYTTIYNGRSDSRTERTITMLVKTLPVFLAVSPDKAVTDFVSETGTQLIDSMAGDIFSFAEISKTFGISADIIFAYQGDEFGFDTIAGEKAESIPLKLDSAKAPLHIAVYEAEGDIRFYCEYRSDIFSRSFIGCFIHSYENAVKEFISKEKLGDISLLDDETVTAMNVANNTQADYEVTDIVSMFRAAAGKYPGNIAVIFGEKEYTYTEVDDISERIAGYLRTLGIGKGSVVSIMIPRCEYMPIAALGVLKSGAAYQPLDPGYPPERLSFMMQDAACALLIADELLLDRVPDYDGPVLLTKDIPDLPACEKITDHPDPEDLFILLYTSGSTGTPKGVMLEHHSLANYMHWYRDYFRLDENCRMSGYASYGFDCCMMDLYAPLTVGACVCIVGDDIRLDLMAVEELFNRRCITHSFMTTQVARQFYSIANVPSLRYLVAAGEKLVPVEPRSDVSTKLCNGYGPTECTILATTHMVERLYERIPIGRPLANYKCYVVDENLNRLPPLVPGELLIAGRGVARGYLNRPELTQKVFLRNPFSDDPEYSHAYRTGDVVRLLPDGNLDFIGRNDSQVKVRGFRIELTEVEGIIREFQGIRDATVQAFDAPSGGKFIAAYIVADEKIDVGALDSFIEENKPSYMVPAVTMQIDSIPLNQNQKVNRRALPEPVFEEETSDEEEKARPMTFFEKEIAQIVKSILGDIALSPVISLTRYGLTSISAISLVVQLDKHFNVELPVNRLLGDASIVDIENLIYEEWSRRGFGATADRGEPELQKKEFYPLSSVQQAVYFDSMKQEENTLYNIPMCFAFKGIDAERLQSAVKAAVSAHSYIGTHIEIRDGELVQIRNDNPVIDVQVLNMSQEELAGFRQSFIEPFDPKSGPLYRFAIAVTEEKTYLFADIHHLVFDGFSTGVLMEDIDRAYQGKELKGETYSYFDYASDDRAIRECREYSDAESYFDNMMKYYESPAQIPADRAGDAESGKMGVASRMVRKSVADGLCRELGVTPSTLFLAAAFYTVSRFARTKDVCISTIDSGRGSLKTHGLLGMFVHTVPLLMHFEKDMTVRNLIVSSGEVIRGSIEHECYPFAEFTAKYGYSTQIMYECQIGVLGQTGSIGEFPYESIPMQNESPKFKLTIMILEQGEDYCIYIRYNDALYSPQYMQTFSDACGICLEHMAADIERPLRTLSLIDDSMEQKLRSFSVSCRADIGENLLHRLFEERAAENPDRTALIACDRSMTYKELNEDANRVAWNLMEKGLHERDLAVLLLPRRSFYFAAMFGVLKCGGAFIPCDPEYPTERIRHIIQDAGAKFILTTGDRLTQYQEENALDIEALISGDRTGNPAADVTGEDLAYLIYTSGSTGKPKGVELRHKGICNYLFPHEANLHMKFIRDNIESYLSVTTVSFDMSFKETAAALCNGKTLVFASEEQMNDPRALASLFERTGADCFNATPSRLMQYITYAPFRKDLGKCRLVMSGGETYPIALRDRLREILPEDARIINTYGPTEITVSSNGKEITDDAYISVGRPLLNYTEHIVDEDMNLLPQGAVGELLIGGPGVARGYRNLPEQTRRSFIEYEGERMYRSGDLARFDEEGNCIILGRIDGQVKLRGLRIEPGEIEGLMEEQPGILRAVAAVRKIGGQENLCAWFTAKEAVDVSELRKKLARNLTQYMVPSALMQIDEIPVTPNGKTDLKALPQPQLLETGEYTAPQNEVEQFFCQLFEKVLNMDRVGATDDFFALGGTSLLATGIMIGATEAGYRLDYGDIFKYRTPRDLSSRFLDQKVENRDDRSLSVAEFDRYDYSDIDEVLSHNNLESFLLGQKRDIGNVLITGATGFMGIHVLAEYLRSEKGTAYCLVRKGKYRSSLRRLKAMLVYYFSEEFVDADERLKVIEGDVTDYGVFESLISEPIDTVFNCAAVVKHFSSGTEIEDINVGGVQKCIRFCKETGARLIHFSTISVAGGLVAADGEKVRPLDEQSLYFGQIVENQYTSSKLLAEREVLSKVADGGLDAKIIRVGTLAARRSDGEFQINYMTNSFMGRLRTYALLGSFPYSRLGIPMRLGPIDESVRSFLYLARTPEQCCLFNAINNHVIPTIDVIRIMNESGIEISVVEDEDFAGAIEDAQKDPRLAAIFASLLAYRQTGGARALPVPVECSYTTQVLARSGFYWESTDRDYIRRFIQSLAALGFFDKDNLTR